MNGPAAHPCISMRFCYCLQEAVILRRYCSGSHRGGDSSRSLRCQQALSQMSSVYWIVGLRASGAHPRSVCFTATSSAKVAVEASVVSHTQRTAFISLLLSVSQPEHFSQCFDLSAYLVASSLEKMLES